jgi:hypothetical protein
MGFRPRNLCHDPGPGAPRIFITGPVQVAAEAGTGTKADTKTANGGGHHLAKRCRRTKVTIKSVLNREVRPSAGFVRLIRELEGDEAEALLGQLLPRPEDPAELLRYYGGSVDRAENACRPSA